MQMMIKETVAAGSNEAGWSPLATLGFWFAVHGP